MLSYKYYSFKMLW